MSEEQPRAPQPAQTPHDAAVVLRRLINGGNDYARRRKLQFQRSSSAVKLLSIGLSAVATVILGLQSLNVWTGVAFSLITVVTVVNAIEPFFNWRSRWVLMEEAQHRFYRLRDDLDYHLVKTPREDLGYEQLDEFFDRYQTIWGEVSRRWLEYRQAEQAGPRGH